MGRVRLKDLSINDLIGRYHATETGRPVSDVLSHKTSRGYVARLAAVERELHARSDDEWLASLTRKERADPERAAQIVKLRRWNYGGSKKGGPQPLRVRNPRLRTVPTGELVERFAGLAIKEDKATGDVEAIDRLYYRIEAIEDELRWRDGEEGLRALLSLYTNPHIAVRERATRATREVALELSRSRLDAIDDDGWTPESGPTGVVVGGPVQAKAKEPKARGKRVQLGDMAIGDLVERFLAISLERRQATDHDEIARVNRLFGLKVAVEEELKRRKGDQRRALLRLLEYPNLQVRLDAAEATLAVDRKAARHALEVIQATRRMPEVADAGMCLRLLDDGTFKPK